MRNWDKGTHLAPGFNPALVNALGLNHVEGIDPMLTAVTTDPLGCGISQLNCEYIHRFPSRYFNDSVFVAVRTLPNFFNKWVVLNEPALNSTPEQAATDANFIVTRIVNSNPNVNNWINLSVLMMQQYQDNAWRTTFWNGLTPFTISKISVLGVHVYPTTLDPVEVRSFLKNTIRNWQNGLSIGYLPLWLHEIGFPDNVYTQEQTAQYIADFVVAFEGVVWLDAVNWFMFSQTEDMHYVPLVNPQQTKLKKAGEAWAAI